MTAISKEALEQRLALMEDAEIIDRETTDGLRLTFIYLGTLIDQERLNESILEPLVRSFQNSVEKSLTTAKITRLSNLEQALQYLMKGSVLVHDSSSGRWNAIMLPNSLSRSIETSETETIMFGPKDSFSEQLEQNILLIRRRLPITALKTERYSVGSLTQTTVVLMYIDGLINPEFVEVAKNKLSSIDFDMFLDSSHVAAFMEDHYHSIFPQYLQTDRPDSCAYALGIGKLVILVNNTPFALVAPITLFHLFQSPEDYINRWLVASFLRPLRYLSFLLSITLIPLYVALTTHHYQMLPLQILYVIIESRSKLPLSPFWEALIILVTLEIIKEASLRMPTKTSQNLGVIGGIVIGQAAVEAGFASKVLIVLAGISAISTFLVPNYLVTKSSLLLQFMFLILASYLGVPGILLGLVGMFAHLNGLTSLNQPYLAPVSPFYWRDWVDFFVRGPLHAMRSRPEALRPLNKYRMNGRSK
ncbi:spore germination protein [Paenibacillus lignilyticus]|uniref:Spore germination protein n=1 Tax=Paenibacillus lignilyticus TaxID=1172615 RepID=A0ABS5CNB8_9BACL|nr:spore germination protein [Paenibacillus lignilyticus]MBP3967355.1 spore germination protein [Paenibacillus lignilyticus]